MKRYLILCVLLTLLLPCMVVPASASQWTSDDVEEIIGGVQTIGSDLYSWFEQWYAYFLEETEPVNTQSGTDILVTPFRRDLIDVQMYVWSWISGVFDTISNRLSSIYSILNSNFPTLMEHIDLIRYYTYYYPNKLAHYFTYKEVEITRYTYEFKDGEMWVYFEPVLVTGLIADLDELFEPIRSFFLALLQGDHAPSNKFEDDMIPIETEVDEWIDSMETAPTINVDDIETEVDKVTDFETDANYLSILSGIFLNEAFLMMFTWCVILAMLGFILYGKR